MKSYSRNESSTVGGGARAMAVELEQCSWSLCDGGGACAMAVELVRGAHGRVVELGRARVFYFLYSF